MPTKPRTSPPLAQAAAPFDWRAHLQVHPEAEHFRPMNETEFEELVPDIKSNGLNTPIVIWSGEDAKPQLLDGRNRLDALARLGLLYAIDGHLCVKMWIDKQKQWATSSGDRI